MIFCFVILHYKNLEETIKCVSSIKDNYLNYNIVIVDNASNDGTGEILCQMYKDYSTINVLIQEEAKGFSYGNNLGIEFAKQNFDPDFLIICNNDVQFVDQDLYLKICQIYKETNFSVMGPDVYYVKMSEHQSPFRNEWMREKETLEEIAYYQKRLSNRLRFDFFFQNTI